MSPHQRLVRANMESPAPAPPADHARGKSLPDNTVLKLGYDDVLMGRGAPCADHEGNTRLRRIVQERRSSYTSAAKRKDKHRIAEEIVEKVHARQGRFLRKVEDASELEKLGLSANQSAWQVVKDRPELLGKVKQLLRDIAPEAKEKRAARRQERRRMRDVWPPETNDEREEPSPPNVADLANLYLKRHPPPVFSSQQPSLGELSPGVAQMLASQQAARLFLPRATAQSPLFQTPSAGWTAGSLSSHNVAADRNSLAQRLVQEILQQRPRQSFLGDGVGNNNSPLWPTVGAQLLSLQQQQQHLQLLQQQQSTFNSLPPLPRTDGGLSSLYGIGHLHSSAMSSGLVSSTSKNTSAVEGSTTEEILPSKKKPEAPH
jgi:hypothetical protein